MVVISAHETKCNKDVYKRQGLRLTKELGYLGSLAICNVPGSSLVRESDLALMTNAGTDIGAASTKAVSYTHLSTLVYWSVLRVLTPNTLKPSPKVK